MSLDLRNMTKALFSILAQGTFVVAAHAAPVPNAQPAAEQEPSLQQQAITESTYQAATPASTAAQANPTLRLHDPGLDRPPQTWLWTLGLGLQRFQPEGQVLLSNGQIFSLKSAKAMTLPSLSLGLNKKISIQDRILAKLGIQADFAYMSQQQEIQLASYLPSESTRLASSLSTGRVGAGLIHSRFPRWQLDFALEKGIFSLSQGGDNDLTNFSRSAAFNGTSVGLTYWYTPEAGIHVESESRSESGQNDIRVQSQSLKAEAKFLL